MIRRLPQTVTATVAELDERLSNGEVDRTGTVDLSWADFLSHDSLLFVVGLFRRRADEGRPTYLRLPRSDTAVDFLRAWRLPEALEAVTANRFEYLLDEGSRARLSRMPEQSRYERVIFKPGGGRETLLPKSFFAIQELAIPKHDLPSYLRTSPRRAASLERDRWLQAHILNVLDLYLSDRGDEIATRVIFEAVLNAAHHPKATVGMVSSQLVRTRLPNTELGDPESLEIAIWDDGSSFAETLHDRLANNLPIHSEAFGVIDEEFDVEVHGSGGQAFSRVQMSSRTPVVTTDSAALMVAAFMLGVTSSPERGGIAHDDTFLGDHSNPAGSGLYYIRRTVVDKFGGHIRYLSGHSRLTLSGGGRRGRYHAGVHIDPARTVPIAGNLLVVTIPVRPATNTWPPSPRANVGTTR